MSDSSPTPGGFRALLTSTVAKGAATAVIGVSLLVLDVLGFVPHGTYLNDFALPVLAFVGLHATAKSLN